MTEDDQADLTAKRERFIAAYIERTGKTREQTLAVMDLVASGLRRRGWVDGEPLTDDQRAERANTFLGPTTSDETATTSNETGAKRNETWATTDRRRAATEESP